MRWACCHQPSPLPPPSCVPYIPVLNEWQTINENMKEHFGDAQIRRKCGSTICYEKEWWWAMSMCVNVTVRRVCVYILLMFHGHKCILLCSFGYIKTENEIVSACSDVRLHNWRLIICYFDVRMHFRLIIFPPKYHNFRRFTTIRRQ